MGVISTMTIRASRGTRLLVAAAFAWLGLALCAQAAHATYSKVTIVKVNNGGPAADTFTYHPVLSPATSDFSIKAGEANSATYQVECNVGSVCSRWNYPEESVTELPKANYTLTGIACYHTQGTNGFGSQPTGSSPADTDTTVAGSKINFKLNVWEWVKCYVTNTYDQGKLELKKSLVPATDAGRFDLHGEGPTQVDAHNVGDGGGTSQMVNVGTYKVSELASSTSPTKLGDYHSWVHCEDKAHPSRPSVDAASTYVGGIVVNKGDYWQCTFTNKRKPVGINIDKTGPATATAGDLVPYVLEVSNTGETSFAEQLVVVTDDLCQAPPALQAKNGDATPTTLDPGDHWTYTCSVQTQLGQTSVVNTGYVKGTDMSGQVAKDQSTATTTLTQPPTPQPPSTPVPPQTPTAQVVAPQQAVSPARATPGSARLRGPSGCPTRAAAAATVTGKRIVKVTFLVDNKKVKTLTKPNKSGGRWVLPLNIRRFAFGSHRVEARIEFAKSSGTAGKKLQLSFNRCRPSIVKPQFTG
jgi:hypothetical protein